MFSIYELGKSIEERTKNAIILRFKNKQNEATREETTTDELKKLYKEVETAQKTQQNEMKKLDKAEKERKTAEIRADKALQRVKSREEAKANHAKRIEIMQEKREKARAEKEAKDLEKACETEKKSNELPMDAASYLEKIAVLEDFIATNGNAYEVERATRIIKNHQVLASIRRTGVHPSIMTHVIVYT